MRHKPFLCFVLWLLLVVLGMSYLIAISVEQTKQGGYWIPKSPVEMSAEK